MEEKIPVTVTPSSPVMDVRRPQAESKPTVADEPTTEPVTAPQDQAPETEEPVMATPPETDEPPVAPMAEETPAADDDEHQNLMAIPAHASAKPGMPIGAVIAAIVIGFALIIVAVLVYMKSKNDQAASKATPATSQSTTTEETVTTTDVDNTTKAVDQSLDSADNAKDFPDTNLSDSSLGLQ